MDTETENYGDKENERITNLNDLHKICIINGTGKIVLEKKQFDWEIISPTNWRVDNFKMSNFLTLFSHLKLKPLFRHEEIVNRGEVLKDYGVDDNSTQLILTKHNEQVTITIGDKTRDSKSIFCEIKFKDQQESKIWRVSTDLIDLVNSNFSDWSDLNLIRTSLYQIDQISTSLKSPNGLISLTTLEKNVYGQWDFTKPFNAKANNENVRFLLNRLLSEQIIDFAYDENNKIITSETKDDWTLKLEIKSNDINHLFYLSESVITETIPYRYCQTKYSKHKFKLNESIVDNLSDWSTKLRERKIIRLKKQDIKKITISNNKSFVNLQLSENKYWFISNKENNTYEGDEENIYNLIDSLNNIEIKEFISFNTDQTEIDLSNNRNTNFRIRIENKDTTIKTLVIQSNPNDASLWKTLMVEESLLCLIEEDWAKIVDKEYYDFMNRKLFSNNFLVNDILITNLESNKTLYDSDLNSTIVLKDNIQNLKVQSFENNESKNDGTWFEGDWVPWIYKISINNVSNNSLPDYKEIYISEQLTPNKWFGSFLNDYHTFNMPIKLIEKLSVILNN